MLKVGVLGAGHLGKIHLKLLNESDRYELVGFFDPMEQTARQVESEFGYRAFKSMDELIDRVDVVDIVTPTLSHYDCAVKAIEKGKHIFIEKPITHTLEQAEDLIRRLHRKGLKGQIGHVERFNPAFTAARPFIGKPMFIEAHRLAEFNPRGTDVPVVLDLMIHDLDSILSFIDSPVKSISAAGTPVISSTPDIVNARIEFENGCVANLTTSRISMKNMRKTRLFQKDTYIGIDYLKKETEIVRMLEPSAQPDDYAMILKNADGKCKQVFFEKPRIEPNNAILDELNTFARAIEEDSKPLVTFEEGTRALSVALAIEKQIEERFQKLVR